MLAGEPPFTGPSTQAIIAKRMTTPAPSVRTLRYTVPTHIERAIDRALARAPADRFSRVSDFATAIHGSTSAEKPSLFRSPLARAAGIVLLLGLAAAVWASTNRRTGGTQNDFAGSGQRAARSGTRDTVAYNLYLSARAQTGRRSTMAVARGIELYQQAIARDSGFADAWAGLARALQFAINWRYPVPNIPKDSLMSAMVRASDRALEADSNSAEAWVARSLVLRELDRTSRSDALEALRHALHIDSTDADVWFTLSNVWQDSLENRRAIDALRRAVQINPRHASALGFIGLNYMWLRKNDSALIWADSAKKVDPSLIWARQSRGQVLRELGRFSEAENEFLASTRLGRGSDQILGWAGLAEIYYKRGDRHAADTIIAHALTLADTTHPTVHDAVYLAWGFTQTGQPERALRILEAYQPRKDMHFQLHLQRDPPLDPLRSKPRFRALLTRQNVPLQ
jgi:tetratricopeptide (TPR) repeat protein